MKRVLILLCLLACASPVFAQQFANGNLLATGDVITAIVPGNTPSVVVQVAGTWTGTLTFTGSVDGVTFTTVTATNQAAFAQATTTTANGIFGLPAMAVLRVTGTSIATGGPAVVTFARGGSSSGGGGGGGSVTQGTTPWIVAGGATYGTPGAVPISTQVCDAGQCASVDASNNLAIAGSVTASGNVASGASDSGAPVKTGGKYNSTLPTFTDGQRGDLQINAKGATIVQFSQPDGTAVTLANDPCGSTTKTSVPIDTATSGNVQLVALSGSTVIYVCAVDVTATATVAVQLIYGTGSACATGETDLTAAYAFSTTTGLLGINKGSGGYYVYKTAAGNALCIELGGAVQVNGSVTYVQQ